MKKFLKISLEILVIFGAIFPTLFLAFWFMDISHKYISVSLLFVSITLSSIYLSWKIDGFKSYVSIFIPFIFSIFIWSISSVVIITFVDDSIISFWVSNFAGLACGIVFYIIVILFFMVFFLHKKYSFFRKPKRMDLHTLHEMVWYFLFMIFALIIASYLKHNNMNYWMILPFASMLILSLTAITIKYEK